MINYKRHLILTKTPIIEALTRLNELSQDAILFVVDSQGILIGSITDGDIRRGLLKGIIIEQSINEIIQPNPRFIKKGEIDIQKVIEYREGLYRIIPVLDSKNRVVNVINFREVKSYLPIDAVIMAGGKGQRLLPLTETCPKPLLTVGDKPIIEHNINRLSIFGIHDLWVCINYLGNMIEDYLGNGVKKNMKISYVLEDEPLGTIGSVSQISDFQHDYILISNSDILTNLDYENFFLYFIKKDADLAVVTIPYQVNIPYAVMETNNENVVSFKEKPTYTYYSNGGIYLIKRSILDYLPSKVYFNATDLMEKLIQNNKKVISYPHFGYWLDIGNPQDYEKAQLDLKNIKF